MKRRVRDKKRRQEGGSKQIWLEKNKDKLPKYWIDSRSRKIQNLGIDEYHKKQAEYASNWRSKNPEKLIEYNSHRRKDSEVRLKSLKLEASNKNIEWSLTDEEAFEMITSNCHYCNGKIDNISNSIDRKYADCYYTKENCVSCCQTCNFMKNTIGYYEFLMIIDHITAYNKLNPQAQLHNNVIIDWISNTYTVYYSSAIKRKKPFELTLIEFEEIIKNPCYICGKENTLTHKNGIDRFDNNIGYVKDNCKSCCYTCNIMKSNLQYEIFINQILDIFINHFIISNPYNIRNAVLNDQYKRPVISYNIKKSKEEIKKNTEIKKKQKNENLLFSYTDEEELKKRVQKVLDKKK